MSILTFRVDGVAAPQGSMRSFMPKGARFPVTTHANKRTKPWRMDVAEAARAAVGLLDPLPAGAVDLTITFHLPRPKGHYRTGKNAHLLKASAPAWPTGKPDVSKLARAVEDALTGICWRDDAQVIALHAEKLYTTGGGYAVVEIEEPT